MSRMLELVRTSQLASHQMMSASKGALRVPAPEMVQILVYIAEHNKVFRDTARMTLAGWDEASAKQIAADPNTPREVLDYWLSPKNIRPTLLAILLENPTASAAKIAELAGSAKNELADTLIASPRVRNSPQVLRDFSANHFLSSHQSACVQALLKGGSAAAAEPEAPAAVAPEAPPAAESAPAESQVSVETPVGVDTPAEAIAGTSAGDKTEQESEEHNPEAESALVTYLAEHANEIAAEGDKPFQAIGGIFDALATADEPAPVKAFAAAAGAGASASTAAGPAFSPAVHVGVTSASSPAQTPSEAKSAATRKPLVNPADGKRDSTLQKIAKLDITGRIQLAMKGSKEERSILIRDGTKIIALAVLESPKISDGEVEKFASQKNVLEAVLRAIPMKRRFAKNYVVMRNLVANPRTPLDVSLGLMKNLLVGDLKNLSGNKEVSETVRKMALRMFRQKNEAANK